MAIRYPLVLNSDDTIQELPVGDSIVLYPTSLPITLHDDSLIRVSIINGEYIPVKMQDGVIVQVPIKP